MKHVRAKSITVNGDTAYVGTINLSWISPDKSHESGSSSPSPRTPGRSATPLDKDGGSATAFRATERAGHRATQVPAEHVPVAYVSSESA
jgi:hypothetical protein